MNIFRRLCDLTHIVFVCNSKARLWFDYIYLLEIWLGCLTLVIENCPNLVITRYRSEQVRFYHFLVFLKTPTIGFWCVLVLELRVVSDRFFDTMHAHIAQSQAISLVLVCVVCVCLVLFETLVILSIVVLLTLAPSIFIM